MELEAKIAIITEKPSNNSTKKIASELDLSLNADISSGEHDGSDFPNVPKRETVNSPPNHIFGIKPPLVHRDSKPLSPKLPKKMSFDDGNGATGRKLSSVNNITISRFHVGTLTLSWLPCIIFSMLDI